MDLQEQFEIFKEAKGDCITRLRKAGYALESLKEDEISTLETFRKFVARKDCFKKDSLRKDLKKIYSNQISGEELSKFLKMNDLNLGSEEMSDLMRIIPINEDGSVFVDELVEFLYK